MLFWMADWHCRKNWSWEIQYPQQPFPPDTNKHGKNINRWGRHIKDTSSPPSFPTHYCSSDTLPFWGIPPVQDLDVAFCSHAVSSYLINLKQLMVARCSCPVQCAHSYPLMTQGSCREVVISYGIKCIYTNYIFYKLLCM